MTAPERPKLLKHLWIWTLLSGIASVVLGVLLVLHPFTGVVFAAILLGAYLLVSGIYQVVFAFSMHVSAGGRILMFISGAAALILGILSFRSFLITEDDATGFLLRDLGRSRFHLQASRRGLGDQRPRHARSGWEIFFGVISILAGIVVMAWLSSLAFWLG
jgi:uncharacterized membrane protein HdeD (DUF308 family)